MSNEVLIFPRGQLADVDREILRDGGIIAIEADDPQSVARVSMEPTVHLSTTSLTGDALVMAALKAMASEVPANSNGSITASGRACHFFVTALAKAFKPKE